MENITGQVPTWIEPELFEDLMRDLNANFKNIRKFQAIPALEPGVNFTSILLRIDIQVELLDGSTNNVSLMLKTKMEDGAMGEISKAKNFFGIETHMYSIILKDFEKLYADAGVTVKLMPNSYKLNTNQDHILMENLKVRDFKNAGRIEGLDKVHIEMALKKIAQWHAASAVYYEQEGAYSKQYSVNNHIDVYSQLYNAMQPSFAEFLEGQTELYKKLQDTKTRIMDKYYEENMADENEFNVLNHGDFWLNNLMFQYDKSGKLLDILLVDFQQPVYTSPVRDIIHLLIDSGRADIKIHYFDYFVKVYHGHLTNNLKILKYNKTIPTLRDLHISVLKNGCFAFLAAMIFMPLRVMDASEKSNFENFVSNTEAGKALRHKIFNNKRYLEHVKLVFPWLLNRGALDF